MTNPSLSLSFSPLHGTSRLRKELSTDLNGTYMVQSVVHPWFNLICRLSCIVTDAARQSDLLAQTWCLICGLSCVVTDGARQSDPLAQTWCHAKLRNSGIVVPAGFAHGVTQLKNAVRERI